MPATTSFDVIVIGVGSMGSAACYYLAKRGYKALGLEQFTIPNESGSHTGQSRIVRKAYFEHPDYVPLMQRAYENWKTFERDTGEQLYYKTGLLYAGNSTNEIIKGVKTSASMYNIELEQLRTDDVAIRFPRFRFPPGFEILFEPDAGFLPPERSIRLYTSEARKHGATILSNEKVMEWSGRALSGEKNKNSLVIKTNRNTYQCEKLIITAGAWAGKMIPGFSNKIRVTRQFVAWIKTRNDRQFELHNFPCWMIGDDDKHGCYYGFPILNTEKFGDPAGLKLAHHWPAQTTDPDHVNREITEEDITNLRYCLDQYLPGTFDSILHSTICLYGNSPDENFIIGKLPGFENNVSIACGFSGHGFKFVPVVGEILADLAIEGKTNLPIEFLNANRFA